MMVNYGTNSNQLERAFLPMAKGKFPTKVCPGCGESIDARSKKHEDCGWVMDDSVSPTGAGKGYQKKPPVNGRGTAIGTISVSDIEAVKKLVDSMGAEKVQELARILAR